MEKAVESLLPGGEETEILIVDDGSTDRTAQIADDYERRYPGIVRAVHQENGGHGAAVMTGLKNASGLWFKVVDSDDWVEAEAYRKILDTLRSLAENPVDMLVSNYIYDKVETGHQHVVHYRWPLPRDRVFRWEETRPFQRGQYILMHSVIYRTGLLRDCGMTLPANTFYVDDLYVYVPLAQAETMYYLDVNFYHYCIGRADQSVQEQIMISRIDQVLLVNRLMVSSVDPYMVEEKRKRGYMLNFLEIITAVASLLLVKSGTEENERKKNDLWAFIEKENPQVYQTLSRRLSGRVILRGGKAGKLLLLSVYRVSRRIIGFN